MAIINHNSISGVTTVSVGSSIVVGDTFVITSNGLENITQISATGVITATSFSGALTGNVTGSATALSGTPDITVGTLNVTDAIISGDLTVQGTTTTLDTVVTEVDKLEVDANNTMVGVAITQSGTGDILRLYDGATQVVTVADGGSVGIGTDNPLTKLDVLVGGDQRLLFSTVSSDTSITAANGANSAYKNLNLIGSDIILRPNGTERLRITSTGNIGIGTDDPNSKIQLVAGNSVAADNGNIVTISSGDGTSGNLVNKLNFGVSSTNNYAWIQSVKPGTNVYPLLLNPLRGNVGIGTDNPSSVLSITSSQPIITLTDSDNGLSATINGSSGNLYYGTATSARDHIFRGSTTEVARITGDGLVGIGTDNPISELMVENATQSHITVKTSGSNMAKFGSKGNDVYVGGTAGAANIIFKRNIISIDHPADSGTETLRITSDGYARLTTANARLEWTASSGSNPFIRSIGTGQQDLEFNTGGGERLRITSGGKIALDGVTPQNVLDLGSGTGNRGISWGGTDYNYVNIWTEYGTADLHIGTGIRPEGLNTGWVSSYGGASTGRTLIKSDYSAGDLTFHTAPASTVADGSAVTVSERLRIASDGQATFDKGAVGGANQVIARFQAESSRRLDIVWHDSGSLMGFDTPSNHSYIFKTNGTERLRIGTSGQLGIAGANYGSSGQVLTSQGSGAAPQWATPAGLSWTETTASSGSGTYVIFQSLPSNFRELVFLFNNVSPTASSEIEYQLATSQGWANTGYAQCTLSTGSGGTATDNTVTAHGRFSATNFSAGSSAYGYLRITNPTGNTYLCHGVAWSNDEINVRFTNTSVALSATLSAVRFYMDGGDFDSGNWKLIYVN